MKLTLPGVDTSTKSNQTFAQLAEFFGLDFMHTGAIPVLGIK